ncbi:MAG: hypothetical protein IKD89_07775 [Clostridia bacterium]|nr:hypothetical protein [Clostridia bacterium]
MVSERKRLLIEAEEGVGNICDMLRRAHEAEKEEAKNMGCASFGTDISIEVAIERLSEAADFIGEALWR